MPELQAEFFWGENVKKRVLQFMGPFLIWIPAVLFYSYQFVLRVSPGVIDQELMGAFQMNATAFGGLSAFYYNAYAMMQMPWGMMIDRYGVRRIILISTALCASGCWLFSTAESAGVAYLARFIIGFGASSALLSCSSLIRNAFAPRHYGLMMALTVAIGTMGALSGGAPTRFLVSLIGWREAHVYIAAAGLLIFAALWFFFPKNKTKKAAGGQSVPLFEGLKVVIRKKSIWLVALCTVAVNISLAVVADTWGATYLRAVYGITADQASLAISAVYAGLCIGSPLLAPVAERWIPRHRFIQIGSWMLTMILCLLVFSPSLSYPAILALSFLMGFFTTTIVQCFSYASLEIAPRYNGVTIALLNGSAMMFCSWMQAGVGWILDQLWTGTMEDGVRTYMVVHYRWALLSVLVICVAGGIGSFFLRPHKPHA